ncbi:expressed protein [Phakopsora pachyrhizi]|uniref:Expressed protein n=1 Tax=Phakopsora pachyrhizi TaxID=170000 RepID=A0AAV0BHE7_PHAPC|nr:expressed protein [Phakopsora pachyrhizi]
MMFFKNFFPMMLYCMFTFELASLISCSYYRSFFYCTEKSVGWCHKREDYATVTPAIFSDKQQGHYKICGDSKVELCCTAGTPSKDSVSLNFYKAIDR